MNRSRRTRCTPRRLIGTIYIYRNGAKAWSRNIIGLIDDQRPRTPTREAMMEGVGLSEEQWGAALRLLQDITEEDKRRATVQ